MENGRARGAILRMLHRCLPGFRCFEPVLPSNRPLGKLVLLPWLLFHRPVSFLRCQFIGCNCACVMLRCHARLGCAMSCRGMPCEVVPCRCMLGRAVVCRAMLYRTMYVWPWGAAVPYMPCSAAQCRAVPRIAAQCRAVPRSTMQCRVVLCWTSCYFMVGGTDLGWSLLCHSGLC